MGIETVAALGAFALLLLALVPRAGCRAAALHWLHRLLHLLLLLTVVACALFHLRPELVPHPVSRLLNAAAERFRAEWPAFAVAQDLLGSPWLAVALVAVAAGLPYLREPRESPCGGKHPPHGSRDDDESRFGRNAGDAPPEGQSQSPRLLKDVLDDPLFSLLIGGRFP